MRKNKIFIYSRLLIIVSALRAKGHGLHFLAVSIFFSFFLLVEEREKKSFFSSKLTNRYNDFERESISSIKGFQIIVYSFKDL
jgi:hypothetical protein